MRRVDVGRLTDAAERLCKTACCVLPPEATEALARAMERETPSSPAASVLSQLLENASLARQAGRPCCQDTGMAVVFLDVGLEVQFSGDPYGAINAGVARAYGNGCMRASVLDPITRLNTGDNTPAVIHVTLTPGDRVHLQVAPKGFGSENMSRLVMLNPADGQEGILRAVVETVSLAGACTCPPVVVGVGIGGTMEQAALLSKRQLLRPLGEAAGEPALRALEQEALARLNALDIGPMGLHGNTTALAVHMGSYPTHIAGLPVAVNLCCHAYRHAGEVI